MRRLSAAAVVGTAAGVAALGLGLAHSEEEEDVATELPTLQNTLQNSGTTQHQRLSHAGGMRGFVKVQSLRVGSRTRQGLTPGLTPEASSVLLPMQSWPAAGEGPSTPALGTPPEGASDTAGRGNGKIPLLWSASRRALEVLVVREEHMSRTSRGSDGLTHDRRLAERLERLNLEMLTMQGDGNCQFRSISFELFGTQDYHVDVRAKVIQQIRANAEEFACFLGEGFEDYVKAMSKGGTWGDELTLRAACDAYQVSIHCVTSDSANWYLTYTPSREAAAQKGEIFLTYIAPIHYNTVRRKPKLKVLSKLLSSSFKRLTSSGQLASISADINST